MALDIKHRVTFKIIAILIPFIGLILIELFLRVINYGYDTRLFIEDSSRQGTFITNTQISKLFFLNKKDARIGILQSFKKIKSPQTLRIFVIGESSSYGFPYTPRASFARMLEDRLTNAFSDKNIEMINLSVTAINSFAFLTFTNEIIEMNPDAVLIYAGHNEYYGAMGVGSSQRVGSNRNILKLVLYLKKFRITQLCFDFTETVKAWFAKNNQKKNKGFMFRMAEDQEITYDSDVFFKGIDQFKNNMDELLAKFSKQKIPVFLSTLVCNEKDQKPFISSLKNTTDSTKFFKSFKIGEQAFLKKDYETFSNCFLASNKIDSTYAMNHFFMGELCYKNGDYAKAERYFSNSKELDALRFRAPEAINTEICLFSNKYKNVHLVDALKEFKEKSQYRILDNKMFMDHLHPNIYGNFLISDAFYNSILETKFFGTQNDTISFENAWKDLPVTDVDSILGMYTNMVGKEQWPFYEQVNFDPDTTNYPEKLTIMMFRNEINMDMAMDSLYRYYTLQNNVEKALKVVKSLALEHPDETRFITQTARLYGLLLNFEQSTLYYKKAFHASPNIDIARKIVFNLLQLDKPEEALPYLKFILQQQPDDLMAIGLLEKTREVQILKNLVHTDPVNSSAVFGLADYYLFVRNINKAKKYIDIALAKYPNSNQTKTLSDRYNKLTRVGQRLN